MWHSHSSYSLVDNLHRSTHQFIHPYDVTKWSKTVTASWWLSHALLILHISTHLLVLSMSLSTNQVHNQVKVEILSRHMCFQSNCLKSNSPISCSHDRFWNQRELTNACNRSYFCSGWKLLQRFYCAPGCLGTLRNKSKSISAYQGLAANMSFTGSAHTTLPTPMILKLFHSMSHLYQKQQYERRSSMMQQIVHHSHMQWWYLV